MEYIKESLFAAIFCGLFLGFLAKNLCWFLGVIFSRAQESFIMSNFFGGFLVGFLANILTKIYLAISIAAFALVFVDSVERLVFVEAGLAWSIFCSKDPKKEGERWG